jgi:hypothetical protein
MEKIHHHGGSFMNQSSGAAVTCIREFLACNLGADMGLIAQTIQ